MSWSSFRSRTLGPRLCVLLSTACSSEDAGGDNVLPTATGSSSDWATTEPLGTSGGTNPGAENTFPATFRMSCVDIQSIGDSDDTVVQAGILEQQWQSDMDNYKLNILVDLLERDDTTGTTMIQIRSGVGTDRARVCSHAPTESAIHRGAFDPTLAAYGPSDRPDLPCAAASNDVMGGSYSLASMSSDVFHIYAEDDDGTTFNCTPDPNELDAVALHAIQTTFTANEEGTRLFGALTGCLIESEAEALCSCLGICGPSDHPNCGGCPSGSIPLRSLLGDIQPDAACFDTMGTSAFTLTIRFVADRLPTVPASCG